MKNNYRKLHHQKIPCTLCNSSKVNIIDEISAECVNKHYLKKYGFSVDRLFKETTIYVYKCRVCKLVFFYPYAVGDDKYYQHLEKTKGYYEKEKYEYKYASRYIKSNSKVLDIGCGEGKFSTYLPDSSFIGLELNSEARKIGLSKKLKILNDTIEIHARKNKEKYDVVTAFQVLEHIVNPSDFIKNSIQCLKDKGILIFAIPNEDGFIGLMQGNELNIPPHHQTRWTNSTLKFIAKKYSLKILSIHNEPLSNVHLKVYIYTMIEHYLFRIFKQKSRFFNCTTSYRVLSVLTKIVGYGFSPAFRIIKKRPIGHCLIVIYQKSS